MSPTVRFSALTLVLGGCGAPSHGVRAPITHVPDPSTADTSAEPPDTATEPDPVAVPGLRAEYYAGYLDLVVARIEPSLEADWAECGPDPAVGCDRFSARFTGSLTAPSTGRFTIAVESDDGVRLWLDDALVIDDWNGHFVTRNTVEVDLGAGVPVALRLDYFELDLAASLRLAWAADGLPEEVIGPEHLSTFDTPTALGGPKPDFVNPVTPYGCPDPGVVAAPAGGEVPSELPFYMVCTGGTFPIRTSRGLVTWTDTGAALLPSGKPDWAANGYRNWAPELHEVGDRFVAYYTSVNGADTLSIGAASSSVPGTAGVLGPYTDLGAPLVEHPDGVLDASFFEDDDGSRWLLYKIDGNAHGRPTPIFIRALASDGLSFAPGSAEVQILVNDPSTWEGGVVEAPWLIRRSGTYTLFYSGNVYDHRYRTGVAQASTVLGPYEKLGDPILANNERWVGPGHGSVVTVGADDWFVYHAWTNDGSGGNLADAGRQVLVDRIDWVDGWPVIHDGTPSRTPQAWPGAE